VLGALVVGGCASVGPATVPRDRLDYSAAMADSWKHQTLLNIVKLRYMDVPVFLDVAQVVSGYQLQTTVLAGGTASVDPSSVPTIGSFLSLGAQGSYTDRPTITYTPLTGDQYIRGLMTPIRPEQIFAVILAGWPADAVMVTSLTSINGLANQRFGGLTPHLGHPKFFRVAQLMRRLQDSGALGFRIQEGKDGTTLLFFRTTGLSDEERQQILETKQLLGLHPEAQEFRLVFGPVAASDREIAVQTRSLLLILLEVSGQISVPPAHVTEGRATRGLAPGPDGREPELVRSMRIHSSKERVADAFLSVRYRDHWFWIDDRDLAAKRNFAFLMFLFAVADTGEKKALPLVTIPAQ
jgi:hypothetical protein